MGTMKWWGFPGGSEVKASACNAGDLGSIPRWGRSSGEGNGNPLQYSCWDNPVDRGVWWATYSLLGHKELDMTKAAKTFMLICCLLCARYCF